MTLRAKLAVHEKIAKCCNIGGSKGRILGTVHEDMKNCMYIHNLFKHLRTTEGIIRERLRLTDYDWKLATQRYGYLKNPASHFVNHSDLVASHDLNLDDVANGVGDHHIDIDDSSKIQIEASFLGNQSLAFNTDSKKKISNSLKNNNRNKNPGGAYAEKEDISYSDQESCSIRNNK